MKALKVSLLDALKNPAAGPRPIEIAKYIDRKEDKVNVRKISLQEYKKRKSSNGAAIQNEEVVESNVRTIKRERGGKLIKIRRELANLYFLVTISKGQEKEKFIREINKLKNVRRNLLKEKKKNSIKK